MATEMSLMCYPTDRVMKGEYLENLPASVATDMLHDFRDSSNDEAEEILHEESEYWHGMSVVSDNWFFTEMSFNEENENG